jgi:hypothetical protein
MKKIILATGLLAMFTTAQAADVSIYQHCNFQGYRIDLPQGNLDMNRLMSMGMKNDDISSIRVNPGAKAVIYQHAGFRGAAKTITSNVSCLVGANFNDIVSSIKVTNAPKKAPPSSGINGRNAQVAIFANGRFMQTGPRSWTEFRSNGQAAFTFNETGRDAWSVYLNDASRNVQIQIDLHRKMITYGQNNAAKRDLYRLIPSSPNVNGQNVKSATIPAGARFVQTGPRTWTEYTRSGQAKFTFTETGRDAWSVYLNDNSRRVQLQIDIHRKMVRYGEDNGAKRDLYRISSSSS